MIVDFHTHTFPDAIAAQTLDKLKSVSHTMPFTDGTLYGLCRSMDRAGIGRSVVLPVATTTRQVTRINDSAAAVNAAQGSVVSFGCMHPHFEDWEEELDRVVRLGLKGIKLHPVYQDVDIDDPRYIRILKTCARLGLVVVTHAGIDVGLPNKIRCSPLMLRRALDRVGPVRLVLAHMGGWRNWGDVAGLLADTGAYLDTSFSLGSMTPNGDGHYAPEDLVLLRDEEFMQLLDAFGPQRVLFGTDSPWGGQEESLADLERLPLSQRDRQAILGQNACALLGVEDNEEEEQ